MTQDNNRTRVTILTDAFRIKGEIDLVHGARVTDYIMDAKDFFAVTNAEVWDLEGRKVYAAPFVDVSRDRVVVISPE